MNKKLIISFLIILISFIYFKKHSSEKTVKIGIQTSPAMALLMIAKDKDFFEKNGVNVELVEFTAGKFALAAFLAGSLDYSVSADVPVTLATLSNNKVIVPAQVVKKTINEVRVVVNNEGKKMTQEEYFKSKKRKLATSISAGPEFFTYEFLNKIGIAKDQIEIVGQNPKDMPVSIVNGSVDAISIYDPFAYFAEREMKDRSTTYTNSDIYSELYLLETSEKVLGNDEQLKNILNSLIDAENYAKNNPEAAKEVVMKYTKLDKETIDRIWSSYDFSIALTNQLKVNFEKQTTWAKETGKVEKTVADPDFSKVIFTKTLQSIDPTKVDL
jgi:NitT/TauT family transport system substrate-binding protein